MRYAPHDKFWVVTDPTPVSTLTDILFETSLAGLERQIRGGLTIADNPTIFTDHAEDDRPADLGGDPPERTRPGARGRPAVRAEGRSRERDSRGRPPVARPRWHSPQEP